MLNNNVGSAMHTVHTNKNKSSKPPKQAPKRKQTKKEHELRVRTWNRWKKSFNLNKPELATFYPDRKKEE